MLIKICGITNVEDARYSLDAGADWIGLNLVGGPRRIDLATVEQIVSQLKDSSCAVVLVHLEEGRIPDSLVATLHKCGVRRLQLYGDPIPSFLQQPADEGFESMVVQTVVDGTSLASLDALLAACGRSGRNAGPDYVLFDASTTDQLGGTGQRADWEIIGRACVQGRFAGWPPVILAGGLTPGNVAEAVQKVSPAGVDVSSGVETKPGRKDHGKISAFIAAVRRAGVNQT